MPRRSCLRSDAGYELCHKVLELSHLSPQVGRLSVGAFGSLPNFRSELLSFTLRVLGFGHLPIPVIAHGMHFLHDNRLLRGERALSVGDDFRHLGLLRSKLRLCSVFSLTQAIYSNLFPDQGLPSFMLVTESDFLDACYGSVSFTLH